MTQPVQRALRILEALVASAPAVQLGELAKQTELTPTTSYRILQTLVTDGYAVDMKGGRYEPGSKILSVAGQMMISMDYPAPARAALRHLPEYTPETVRFGVLAGDYAQYVDKLEGRRPYRIASMLGMTLSLHCTSIGQAILAHLPKAQLERLIEPNWLIPHTPRTIADPQRMPTELVWIREHGFAIDDEEDREGVRCLVAPVFDQVGLVMGAISVSAPAVHLAFSAAVALALPVIEAANQVSLALSARHSALPNAPEGSS